MPATRQRTPPGPAKRRGRSPARTSTSPSAAIASDHGPRASTSSAASAGAATSSSESAPESAAPSRRRPSRPAPSRCCPSAGGRCSHTGAGAPFAARWSRTRSRQASISLYRRRAGAPPAVAARARRSSPSGSSQVDEVSGSTASTWSMSPTGSIDGSATSGSRASVSRRPRYGADGVAPRPRSSGDGSSLRPGRAGSATSDGGFGCGAIRWSSRRTTDSSET